MTRPFEIWEYAALAEQVYRRADTDQGFFLMSCVLVLSLWKTWTKMRFLGLQVTMAFKLELEIP
jgi:hypothetical protein